MINFYRSQNCMLGVCGTLNRGKQLISQRCTTSNGTNLFCLSMQIIEQCIMNASVARNPMSWVSLPNHDGILPFSCVKCFDVLCHARSHPDAKKLFEKNQNLKLQWVPRHVFDLKKKMFVASNHNKQKKSKFEVWMNLQACFWCEMNFVASNHDKYKKHYSEIIEMLKKQFDAWCIVSCTLKNVWANSNFEVVMNSQACFWLQLNFIASNHNEHKKDIQQS